MSKTIEEELGTHFGRLDKALDGLVKTYEKFIHGISPEQRAAVSAHLHAKLAATETRLRLAGASAGGFSFQAPTQPMQGGPLFIQSLMTGLLGPTGTIVSDERTIPTAALRPPTPAAITKPIGRIAKTGGDPNAGQVLIAAPIVPARTTGAGTTGVGFLGANDKKDAEIESL